MTSIIIWVENIVLKTLYIQMLKKLFWFSWTKRTQKHNVTEEYKVTNI